MRKKRLLILALIILGLSIVWEFSHYPLYNDLSSITGPTHLIIASFGDLLWISLIFSIISLFNHGVTWIQRPKKLDYFFIILLSLIIAISIEIINVYYLFRWEYLEAMPLVLGIGLSPLIQLFTTSLIGLLIYRKFIA